MNSFPRKLSQKLSERKENSSLRQLLGANNLVDFSSNDYLGFSKSRAIFDEAATYLKDEELEFNGSTGSRLLSGNHPVYNEAEAILCKFYQSESALIFNSGYDANIGFFSSVPQRGDIVLYDELIHASIRDGIRMSNAKAYKYKHNNINDLICQIERNRNINSIENEIYIVSESVFSMDGDSPDLKSLVDISEKFKCHLIIDEAHAVGVVGKGAGLLQELNIHNKVFARIVTFGKALGCHGAAILGEEDLRNYLVNFARSFIYTTALPPHSVAAILTACNFLMNMDSPLKQLKENINFFKEELIKLNLGKDFIESSSAIQSYVVPGNTKVKRYASAIQKKGYDVKPVLSPTVPVGEERLRFCLHSYNTFQEISGVLKLLATFER
ncbi:aminotransferase class I/II-fold pyridoxal phosphate-dependent enzyme [Abyssalbus ytuae]|uniref:8-amino-7-oxononanoate synthase n=1 Tax=Abyssalbus ytuae TaxID=2926907 RepID=A0A9E6ZQU3_9FLAO|nr:8-amino-7-oxononanoate synthase [Abyssalbus ytuae]UOB16213.1 8-amino-7-oxononanoate synthase [Abyssalbus ytuae]